MYGMGSWFFALVPMLFGLAAAIFIIILLYRLVVAVEKIADKIERR